MTKDEALAEVIATAAMWGENAEESFSKRLTGAETDEQKQVRDLWKAIEILTGQPVRKTEPEQPKQPTMIDDGYQPGVILDVNYEQGRKR